MANRPSDLDLLRHRDTLDAARCRLHVVRLAIGGARSDRHIDPRASDGLMEILSGVIDEIEGVSDGLDPEYEPEETADA